MIEDTNADDLIARARKGDAAAFGRLLESYRSYLGHLSHRQLSGRIGGRVSASDIVQQTFLEAHRDFPRFLGTSQSEFIVWLQHILAHNVAGALRDHTQVQKRAV
jgi:RNA polymerase sigma-70 factor (ECF subfamily)